MKDPVEVTAGKVVPEHPFRPTSVRLYGVPVTRVRIRDFEIWIKLFQDDDKKDGKEKCTKERYLAVIYGYAYEGHCYSLPKPCIISVDDEGECAVGCGYDRQNLDMLIVDRELKNLQACGQAGGSEAGTSDCKPPKLPGPCVPPEVMPYRMWTLDKLTKTFEISITSGFIEDVILQQNIGGPKPPVAYGARVQLAHRGGKLTE